MVFNEEKAKYIIKTFSNPNWMTVAHLQIVYPLFYKPHIR